MPSSAPEAIPVSLLEQTAAELGPNSKLGSALRDRVELNQAVSVLIDYSLLSRQDDRLSLHRLIPAVLRDSLPDEKRQGCASSAVRMVGAAFPEESQEPSTWADCRDLLPHALIAAGLAKRTEPSRW